MMLTAELIENRKLARATMASEVTVKRLTRTPDGTVRATRAYSTSTTLPCRVRHRTGTTLDQSGRVVAVTTATITMPWGSDVRRSDVLVVGTRTYSILDLNDDESYGVSLRAICTETS